MVFHVRVAFPAFADVALIVLLKTARPERDAVVKLHVRADDAAFADDDAGAVIDEKVRADLRAGMDVDTGAAVRPFRHHARNEGQMFLVKEMRHALDGDGFDGRIRENNFFVADRSRIAFVGGVDIRPKHDADLRELGKKEGQHDVSVLFRGRARFYGVQAFANLRFHSRVQRRDALGGHLR